MKRMFGHYQTLLEEIVAQPEQRILDVRMLTSAEQRQLLGEWNSGEGAEFSRLHGDERRPPRIAPRTPVEMQLATIWREIRGVEKVDLNDSFFAGRVDSGQHDKFVAKASAVFGVELTLSSLLESPTVASLSTAITQLQTRRQEQQQLDILRMLEQLSDDEIEERLNRRGDAGYPVER